MDTIKLEFRISIMRGDRILVPGCEPTSVLTSTTMAREMREDEVCAGSIVDLADVLEAIPEATIERIPNGGYSGNMKVLVLPAFDTDCPCTPRTDYYQILRNIGREATEEEIDELTSGCSGFSVNLCEKQPEWRGQIDAT